MIMTAVELEAPLREEPHQQRRKRNAIAPCAKGPLYVRHYEPPGDRERETNKHQDQDDDPDRLDVPALLEVDPPPGARLVHRSLEPCVLLHRDVADHGPLRRLEAFRVLEAVQDVVLLHVEGLIQRLADDVAIPVVGPFRPARAGRRRVAGAGCVVPVQLRYELAEVDVDLRNM